MKTTSSSGIYKNIYHDGSYLERENDKVMKFHANNSSYLALSTY